MANCFLAAPKTLKYSAVTLVFQSGLIMDMATQYFAISCEILEWVFHRRLAQHNSVALSPIPNYDPRMGEVTEHGFV